MKRLACLIFGHKVEVHFFWSGATLERVIKHRAVHARAVCGRCGKSLSKPANPPRGTR